MKRSSLMLLILLLSVSLTGCMRDAATDLPNNTQPSNDALDKQAVAAVVDNFGHKMQLVSLLAPPLALQQSLQDNYGGLASPALLEMWQKDPQNAPGRLVSSPWPDRIEVLTNEKQADGSYEVKGEIMEITSAEHSGGGVAAKRPVTLNVQRIEGKWLINGVTMGVYGDSASLIYSNPQLGFTFRLPKSWQNYSVVTTNWEGVAMAGQQGGQVVQNGLIINLRHPQWTQAVPRQDIPIMVFTIDQWNFLLKEEFSVGAAPIPPSELGRNTRYILALPARYNYAFPPGFEEVETILNGQPLQTCEPFSPY